MGFKNFINGEALLNTFKSKLPVKNSKKIAALIATFLLGGTQVLMAQTDASGTVTPGSDDVDKSAMWASVEYYVLIFLLLCIVVAIVGRILKVYDLSNQLQGKKSTNWNNVLAWFFAIFLVVGGFGAAWSLVVQGGMILPAAVSKHGAAIDSMFWTTTALTLLVFIITQILLFVFLYIYRYSEKRKAYFLPHNNTIEKVWTIAPAIVLTILVVFGFFTWRNVTNTAETKGDINIDITGHQFAWELRYPGKDGKLGLKDFHLVSGSNNLGVDFKDRNSFDDLRADTLVLPVNKSIRLNIIAQDVIHSVYLPYFRVQINAVPGLPTFFKFVPTATTNEMRTRLDNPTFEYVLYCNKICGGGHYNMQKVVRVVTEAEYNDWLSRQKPYLSDALKKELKFADAGQQNGTSNRLALNN